MNVRIHTAAGAWTKPKGASEIEVELDGRRWMIIAQYKNGRPLRPMLLRGQDGPKAFGRPIPPNGDP